MDEVIRNVVRGDTGKPPVETAELLDHGRSHAVTTPP